MILNTSHNLSEPEVTPLSDRDNSGHQSRILLTQSVHLKKVFPFPFHLEALELVSNNSIFLRQSHPCISELSLKRAPEHQGILHHRLTLDWTVQSVGKINQPRFFGVQTSFSAVDPSHPIPCQPDAHGLPGSSPFPAPSSQNANCITVVLGK